MPDSQAFPANSGRLVVDVQTVGAVTEVTVHGEIDVDTVEVLSTALARVTTSENVLVDLSDVPYMDSGGLRVLLLARDDTEQRGGRLRVIATSSIVGRLFEIAGVTELLSDGGRSTSS